jgi:hypothetical protein
MKIRRIWVVYLIIKIFYMCLAIFVFSRLTTLGDTFDYLNSALQLTPKIFYSSTAFMQFAGALSREIFRLDVIACIPFMLLSFYGIYYAVDRLNLYRYAPYLLVLFSLPNFCIWTSILGKEAVGCFYISIIAVVLVKKLRGPYAIKLIEYFALYLCAMFKPQYLLFILQAIVFLTLTQKFKDKKYVPLIMGSVIIALNIFIIYLFRLEIDMLAKGFAVHFKSTEVGLGQSTRSELPWLEPFGFFKHAPYGMMIAFFGPTFSEMISKPTHLLSGIESLIMLICFLSLVTPRIGYILIKLRFNSRVVVTYFIIFVGILFIHYPFGFLNPGSAIRYRANFYPLFIFLLIDLFARFDVCRKITISTPI